MCNLPRGRLQATGTFQLDGTPPCSLLSLSLFPSRPRNHKCWQIRLGNQIWIAPQDECRGFSKFGKFTLNAWLVLSILFPHIRVQLHIQKKSPKTGTSEDATTGLLACSWVHTSFVKSRLWTAQVSESSGALQFQRNPACLWTSS